MDVEIRMGDDRPVAGGMAPNADAASNVPTEESPDEPLRGGGETRRCGGGNEEMA